jgi:hypothetical protein
MRHWYKKHFGFVAIMLFIIMHTGLYSRYHFLISERINLLALGFGLAFYMIFAAYLVVFRRWWLQLMGFISLISLYLWQWANYAHFQVFNKFLDVSFTESQAFRGGMLDLVKNFSNLVPTELYVTGITAIILTIWLSFKMKAVRPTLQEMTGFDFNAQLKRKKRHMAMVTVFALFIVQTAAGIAGWWQMTNPKDTWWNMKVQSQDLGLLGQAYTSWFEVTPVHDIAFAATQKEDISVEPIEAVEEGILEPTLGLDLEAAKSNPLMAAQHFYSADPAAFASGSLPQEKLVYTVTQEGQPEQEAPLNILMVQLESTSSWAVNQNPSPMPFLRQLMDENITVQNFHANSCETINAEFATNCSFIPNTQEPISFSHTENRFNCVPDILEKRHGYDTFYYHANVADFWSRNILTPAWGFNQVNFSPIFDTKAHDRIVLKKAIADMATQENPFYAYITTFTSHAPHNQELVDYHRRANDEIITPFAEELGPATEAVEIPADEVRYYFGFMRSTDDALRDMFADLEKTGLRDNTMVVIHNDHRYYNFDASAEQAFDWYNQSPMVIVMPPSFKNKQQKIQSLASHIDLAPTILHTIEQDDYQKPAHFLGESLFHEEHRSQIFNTCLGNTYYLNNDVLIQGNSSNYRYRTTTLHNDVTADQQLRAEFINNGLTHYIDRTLFDDQLVPKSIEDQQDI